MLTFNGVTSERADEILSGLDKNVLEKLAEVLGNIGASTFFIEEVFNKHNYLNTVAYFVIPMVGVGTGKVVLLPFPNDCIASTFLPAEIPPSSPVEDFTSKSNRSIQPPPYKIIILSHRQSCSIKSLSKGHK